tara:strand:- start:2854 stop:3138 length:285 start_codon:yes stop_codon:yes gene_type:complete
MSEVVKFTDEEMKELKSIQEKYLEVQNNLGQTQVSLIRLEQQQENLLNYSDGLRKEFNEVQEIEKTFIAKVTDKYGDGELNQSTGEFISQKTKK